MIEAPTEPRLERDTPTRGKIRFPRGLLGFPDVTEYRLVQGPADGLFWLVAEASDAPRFLLSDPFVFFEGLGLDVSPAQARQIEAHDAADVAVLAITVPDVETGVWTANLQGPVVINVHKALGAQLVLSDQSLGVKRPFSPSLASA